MNGTVKARSFNILCLLAPVLAVALTPFVIQGPRSAMAQGMDVPFVPLPEIPEGFERGAPIGLPSTIESPFPIIELSVLDVPAPGFSGESRVFDPSEAFVLTSVMPSPTRPLAVINGRACRPGQRLGAGWSVSGVDPSGRSVTIEHISGQTRTLRLRDDRP